MMVFSYLRNTLQLLEETGHLAYKPAATTMDPTLRLSASHDDPLPDTNISSYHRLIGKFLYLTLSHPDICFSVHKLTQVLAKPCTSHVQAANHFLRYHKAIPDRVCFSPPTPQLNYVLFPMPIGHHAPTHTIRPLVIVFSLVTHSFHGRRRSRILCSPF